MYVDSWLQSMEGKAWQSSWQQHAAGLLTSWWTKKQREGTEPGVQLDSKGLPLATYFLPLYPTF